MGGSIQKTDNIKWMIALRVIAGLPLVAFGVMHISSVAPMEPLLEAAGLPGFLAYPASLGEIVAGILLLIGLQARIGAAIAIGAMIGAVYTHVQIPSDGWPETNGGPQEPPLMYLAIVIILVSAVVGWKGAGAFSLDRKGAPPADQGA